MYSNSENNLSAEDQRAGSHNAVNQHYPPAALYVLATPIGNIADITFRAHHVLNLVDAIACEDTRHTAQLLNRYLIKKPLIALHQHNELQAAEQIQQRLRQGERIAYVADAGTPAISDPGARLVEIIRRAELKVIPIPGVCALTTALSIAGLSHPQFYFAGFLPAKSSQRQKIFHDLLPQTATLVFYEAPHRVLETIADFQQIFPGTRRLVIARELTKLFEQVYTCELSDALEWLKADAQRQKGEFVLLLEGHTPDPSAQAADPEVLRILKILSAELPTAQAATLAAQITGQRKKMLYELALTLK